MNKTLTISDQLAELGTLENNEEKAPQRVGARLIDEHFNPDSSAKLDDESIANLLYFLTDIQVRDYALGSLGGDTKTIIGVLTRLIESAPEDSEYVNAPATLMAALSYEAEDNDNAVKFLKMASNNYSLALLLRRVFAAGWNPASFAAMRNELHPKVVAGIFGDKE